jgi:hypothetical protein
VLKKILHFNKAHLHIFSLSLGVLVAIEVAAGFERGKRSPTVGGGVREIREMVEVWNYKFLILLLNRTMA